MNPGASTARGGLVLAGVAGLLLALAVAGLALHGGFQPAWQVRTAAPAIALVAGAAFTHRLARWRSAIDVPGEFNPGGRALFLGLVMLVVTGLAWLAAAQAVPAFVNAATGAPRSESGSVVAKVPVTDEAGCTHRLELTSASLARPLDECVDAALWARAAPGAALTVDVVGSRLGAEFVAVRP